MFTHTNILAASFAALATTLGGLLYAQEQQVDHAEIVRRGNVVQHIDGKIRSTTADEFTDAMGPPADDNHKWFISVVGMKSCAPCARLKADMGRDPHLKALVTLADGDPNHSDTKTSWSHYNFYDKDDASQKWRFESIKITGYPTIIIQPPLNKKYGDPSAVVIQITGYDGDGKKLANGIAAGIKAYLAKQAERRAAATAKGHRVAIHYAGHRQQAETPIGLDPPWTPAPKVDPPAPNPLAPVNPSPDAVLPPIFNWPPPDAAPATPATNPGQPGINPAIPSEPELTVVVDTLDSSACERANVVFERLKRDRPGIVARVRDFREVKHLNVKRDELPAVVATADGRVQEKIGGRLFDLLNPKVDATIQPSVKIDVPPFPWSEIVTAIATGGSLVTVVPAIIGVVLWIRGRRQAAGKPVLMQGVDAAQLKQGIDMMVTIAQEFLKSKQPPANPPATT